MQINGFSCPTSGEIAGRDIPSDSTYFLTTFGGGADAQPVACGGPAADGTWYYCADSWRFGCGTLVLISNPATGAGCVAQVADVGPNVCVEQAAGRPVIDASPLVAQALFGTSSLGWSSRSLVLARVVDPSTPLGPTAGDTSLPDTSLVPGAMPQAALTGFEIAVVIVLLGGAGYAFYTAWQQWQARRLASSAPTRRTSTTRRST